MANVLNLDKKITIIGALAEGNSIRSIEPMTGVHRDTIMRLGVPVGQSCTALMDEKMRNLLHVDPAVSPLLAVRAAILEDYRDANPA